MHQELNMLLELIGVPIAGDGEGGFVSITVADGTDAEGATIPGQINNVVVTSPGKNYTTASIDIESIPRYSWFWFNWIWC